MEITNLILTSALIAGQLIKLPILTAGGGLTILDLIVLIFCLVGLYKLKFKLKKPPLFLTTFLIFIFFAILSLALTPLHLKPTEYLSSFFYTIRLSAYFLLGWEIYIGAFPSIKRNLTQILILSGLSLAILGLIQLAFLPDLRFLQRNGWDPHYFRTVSTFLDPNFLGGYLVLTLILLFKTNTKLHILISAVVYLALLTTFSRGAYLAFFTGFITLSLLSKSLKLGILTILLSAGLLFGYYNYQRSIAAPRNIDRAQSAQFRLNAWQQGSALFQQAPVLGVGYNSYRYALQSYHLAGADFLRTHGSSTNDSSLLFVASTTGVIGLTSYLFFLVTLLKFAWQKYLQKNIWGIVCIAGVSGVLIQSFFANTLFYPFILIWIILVSTKLSE